MALDSLSWASVALSKLVKGNKGRTRQKPFSKAKRKQPPHAHLCWIQRWWLLQNSIQSALVVHFKDVVDLRGQGTRGWAGVLAVVKHKEKGEEASEEHDTVKERQCTIRELRCINLTGKGTDWLAGGLGQPSSLFLFFFPLPASVLPFIRLVRCLGSPHNCLGIWKGVGLHASPYHLKDRSGI